MTAVHSGGIKGKWQHWRQRRRRRSPCDLFDDYYNLLVRAYTVVKLKRRLFQKSISIMDVLCLVKRRLTCYLQVQYKDKNRCMAFVVCLK